MATQQVTLTPAQLQELIAAATANIEGDMDNFWLLYGTSLVFFMQCGFALVEAGAVRSKNVKNILLKNVMDACLGATLWWAIGFAFAFGEVAGKQGNGFIGMHGFFLLDSQNQGSIGNPQNYLAFWMFQWSFAATAATIVSGAVAERCAFEAYLIYTIYITLIVYPPGVHWCWSGDGWMSAFNSNRPAWMANGFMDFAGSGVVHACGGSAAFMAAIFLGPRFGRFDAHGAPQPISGHSTVLQSLGTLILWFAWYGFNPVSTIKLVGSSTVATQAAVNTTLSGALGGISSLLVHVLIYKNHVDLPPVLNGILGGLVTISACCSVVYQAEAMLAGFIGGIVYYLFAQLLLKLRIDDPLEASAVHLACGVWGILSLALFANEPYTKAVYGDVKGWGLLHGGGLQQFAVQLLGVFSLVAWGLASSGLLFFVLAKFGWFRVAHDEEVMGLDISHHGGSAYAFDEKLLQVKLPMEDAHAQKQLQPHPSAREKCDPLESTSALPTALPEKSQIQLTETEIIAADSEVAELGQAPKKSKAAWEESTDD